MPNTAADAVLDIAVGILRDASGRVLIACRRSGTVGAGLWEFPGGKHEPGETMRVTLVRELQEELGITPLQPQPLICMRNPAAMRPVRLHVWLITQWQGTAHGREGQRIEWCPPAELPQWQLLPGNQALLNALALPPRITHISPSVAADRGRLQELLATAPGLLCLQAPTLADKAYAALAQQLLAWLPDPATPLLLDRSATMVGELGAAGLYWPVERLDVEAQRLLGPDYLFGVSVCDAEQLHRACRAAADFAVLAQPGEPFDWPHWRQQRGDVGLPVYAMTYAATSNLDVAQARAHNAQGVVVTAE